MARKLRSEVMKDFGGPAVKTPATKPAAKQAMKSNIRSPAVPPATLPKFGKSQKSTAGSLSGSKRMSRKH